MLFGRLDTSTLALATFAAGLLMAGCGPGDVEQYNHPGRITSIGPVEFDDRSVLVDYTLFDREGDDVAIDVGVCPEGDDGGVDCPTPVTGANGDGMSRLPTAPQGTDVLHRLSWNVGCGRVDGSECLETDLDQSYVVHISVEGSDQTFESDPFSLSETFSREEVPACDTSAATIPDPCSPDTDQ